MFSSLFLPSLTPSSPFLSQISIISPGPDFTKICHPLLFSPTHPFSFQFSKEWLFCFPISDCFPPSAHFAPPHLLLSPGLFSALLLITCQSLTSSPLFSLRYILVFVPPPSSMLLCLYLSISQLFHLHSFNFPLFVLLLFSLFITVTCFIRPKLIKHWPSLPPALPG